MSIKLSRRDRRRMKVLASATGNMADADRRFFERFPTRQHRVRIAAAAEVEAVGIIGGAAVPFRPHPEVAHYVAVKQIAPGVRFRVSFLGRAGADTDINEETARAIYEEAAASNPKMREIEAGLREAAIRRGMEARG